MNSEMLLRAKIIVNKLSNYSERAAIITNESWLSGYYPFGFKDLYILFV